jgi:hypothetical protein
MANTKIMALGLASAEMIKMLSMNPKNNAIGSRI